MILFSGAREKESQGLNKGFCQRSSSANFGRFCSESWAVCAIVSGEMCLLHRAGRSWLRGDLQSTWQQGARRAAHHKVQGRWGTCESEMKMTKHSDKREMLDKQMIDHLYNIRLRLYEPTWFISNCCEPANSKLKFINKTNTTYLILLSYYYSVIV